MDDAQVPPPASGHNGGPALDDYEGPPWGEGHIYRYVCWRRAHRAAWRKPRDIQLFRLEKAEKAGLTYEEYSLEIMERGRHIQPDDAETIARIKARRKR
ncbi:hypothetical protein [Terrarubrum flagellatum]|uniref:hypothetical protein n=1 Tax=Terrirubrum flagellatum TaxID=2895980 RepID=UPI0031451E92